MEVVIRHWHFAHGVASTIPKEETERQATEPPIFLAYFYTGHISPLRSYQILQKVNMNHNPLCGTVHSTTVSACPHPKHEYG